MFSFLLCIRKRIIYYSYKSQSKIIQKFYRKRYMEENLDKKPIVNRLLLFVNLHVTKDFSLRLA